MKSAILVLLAMIFFAAPACAGYKEIVEKYENSLDKQQELQTLQNIDQDLKEANAKSQ